MAVVCSLAVQRRRMTDTAYDAVGLNSGDGHSFEVTCVPCEFRGVPWCTAWKALLIGLTLLGVRWSH